MKQKEGRERRSWKSMRMTARFHSRYMSLWVLSSAIPIIALNFVIYLLFDRLWISSFDNPAEAGSVRSILTVMLTIETATLLFSLWGLYVLAMHKLCGPYINIKNTLTRINTGDWSARLRFRTEDRLDDIADAFNAVMEKLAKSPAKREHENQVA